eukprot:1419749-Pyramimonas_sp.AAC.1
MLIIFLHIPDYIVLKLHMSLLFGSCRDVWHHWVGRIVRQHTRGPTPQRGYRRRYETTNDGALYRYSTIRALVWAYPSRWKSYMENLSSSWKCGI